MCSFFIMKFFACFILLIIDFRCNCHQNEDSLRLVHVFFRHGSRAPELKDIYPADPYKADAFQPEGYGQLTNKGKRMSYDLGLVLRERYNTFLGNVYTPEIAWSQSTDFDRTKMSLLLVLAGLFKPSPPQQWNEDLLWQPVPIHYEKDSLDYTLRRPTHYCPTYLKELHEVYESSETISYLKSQRDTFEYLTENSGKPIKNLEDVFALFQTLTAESTMNLTLPEWTKKVFPVPISGYAGKQCELENSNDVLKRLNGGRMLGKVIRNMVDKTKGRIQPEGRKVYLYSGHENNVINILAALDLFKPHVSEYSSAVILELHETGHKKFAVKVYYLKGANRTPEVQKLHYCDEMCPLERFIKLTENHVPKNYTEECGSTVNLDQFCTT